MQQKGFIKLIILVVIGLVVLKFFFEFDVIEYLKSDTYRSFMRPVWKFILILWKLIVSGLVFAWTEGREFVVKAIEIIKGWSS